MIYLKSIANSYTAIRGSKARRANQCYRGLPVEANINRYITKFIIQPYDTINTKIYIAIILLLVLIFPEAKMHTWTNKPGKSLNFIERVEIKFIQAAQSKTFIPNGCLSFKIICGSNKLFVSDRKPPGNFIPIAR